MFKCINGYRDLSCYILENAIEPHGNSEGVGGCCGDPRIRNGEKGVDRGQTQPRQGQQPYCVFLLLKEGGGAFAAAPTSSWVPPCMGFEHYSGA